VSEEIASANGEAIISTKAKDRGDQSVVSPPRRMSLHVDDWTCGLVRRKEGRKEGKGHVWEEESDAKTQSGLIDLFDRQSAKRR
jgi:hypothetical protein